MVSKILKFGNQKGSSLSLPAHGWVGARATILSFSVSVPPSARKKIWPSNQAGEKEGGWGEGIFARLFCAVGAVGWEAFPPFGIKPNIKAKQFSIPFKRKKARAKYKKLKENCFALLAEFRRAETLGRGFKSFERFSLEKGSSFVQQLRPD